MDRPPVDPLLIVASVVFVLGLLPVAALLMFAPMMFDAPGSEQSIYPWLIIGSLLIYPLCVLLGLGLAWTARARGDASAARRALLVPLLGVALIVASVALLQVVCAGQFACR